MLLKINKIAGVGLFHDTDQSPPLAKTCLIYGENGRGKSTLACILHSCGVNDPELIYQRRTLDDGASTPIVQFLFRETTGVETTALLDPIRDDKWYPSIPDIRVFDANFVNRNVYSGIVINPDNRASLLAFALGDDSVALRLKLDELTAQISSSSSSIGELEQALMRVAGQIPLPIFLTLPPLPSDAHENEGRLLQQIAAATAKDQLSRKPIPVLLTLPEFNCSRFFTLLSKSLQDVEAEAERVVQAQLTKCLHEDYEDWLSQGQTFTIADECPYCGLPTQDNDVIKAYQTYFNQAYTGLKQEISVSLSDISETLNGALIDRVELSTETEQARIDGWKEYIELTNLELDKSAMTTSLNALRDLMTNLIEKKQAQPLEKIGTDKDMQQADTLWADLVKAIEAVNAQIRLATVAIEAYKAKLQDTNTPLLKQQHESYKVKKIRHSDGISKQVDRLEVLKAEKARLSLEKKRTRVELDELMTATLTRYQTEINTLLVAFGAQISIEALSFNYAGTGTPRTDFELHVRGRKILLTGEGAPSFGNTLSEGDKRSLAFAFFIAGLHSDPNLGQRVVVIDDPMCSLDTRRKSETTRVLAALSKLCKQLIVMAHDAYFLRDLNDKLKTSDLSLIRIVSTKDNYSSFAKLDLERECEATYASDIRVIQHYLEGTSGFPIEYVASRVRVLTESSLIRQFPHCFSRKGTLGDLLRVIQEAKQPSPLVNLQASLSELRSINDYAKQFHHSEDSAETEKVTIDEGELRQFCARALHFVLRGK